MSLSFYIKQSFPSGIDTYTLEQYDLIGSHMLSEVNFVKLQHPAPTPNICYNKTPYGSNLQICQSFIEPYIQFGRIPNLKINPFKDTNCLSYYVLFAMMKILEENIRAQILYYNTPNPLPPPAGFPATPLPKPIPGSLIPLTNSFLNSYIEGICLSTINIKYPGYSVTQQFHRFVNSISSFIINEVFS